VRYTRPIRVRGGVAGKRSARVDGEEESELGGLHCCGECGGMRGGLKVCLAGDVGWDSMLVSSLIGYLTWLGYEMRVIR